VALTSYAWAGIFSLNTRRPTSRGFRNVGAWLAKGFALDIPLNSNGCSNLTLQREQNSRCNVHNLLARNPTVCPEGRMPSEQPARCRRYSTSDWPSPSMRSQQERMVTRADEVSAATRKSPPRSNHKLLVDAQAFRRCEDCEESRGCASRGGDETTVKLARHGIELHCTTTRRFFGLDCRLQFR
jgi:hypothetical protein